MKTHVAARLLPLAFTVLSLVPARAFAQTTDRAPVHPSHPAIAFGNSGKFKSTDGTTGTFRETETVYDTNATSNVALVYTRTSDGATRVEQTDNLANADGTHTRNFTSTDYNASSSFVSSLTITTLGRGQSVGQGRYTTAAGVSGTLTSVETTSAVGVDVLTLVYNDPTGGVSTEQRTTTDPYSSVSFPLFGTISSQIGFISFDPGYTIVGTGGTIGMFPPNVTHKTVIKTVTVDASGQVTNAVQTRTSGSPGLEGVTFK